MSSRKRERRKRTFLVDYAHPKLGIRTLKVRAAMVAPAVRIARRSITRTGGRYLGIREP